MRNITITKEYQPYEKQIRSLYQKSFPKAERKPFKVLQCGIEKGLTRIYAVLADGQFGGMMVTWQDTTNSPLVLLDYFAIEPTQQGGGIGTGALKALQAEFEGLPILIEIERIDETPTPENQTQRERRRAFYLREGFVSADIYSEVFGVQMELLTIGGSASVQEYLHMYKLMSGPIRTKRYVHILSE